MDVTEILQSKLIVKLTDEALHFLRLVSCNNYIFNIDQYENFSHFGDKEKKRCVGLGVFEALSEQCRFELVKPSSWGLLETIESFVELGNVIGMYGIFQTFWLLHEHRFF